MIGRILSKPVQGKCIGITSKPKLGYKDGDYYVIVNPNKPCVYIPTDDPNLEWRDAQVEEVPGS